MATELTTTRKTIVGVQFLFVAFGSTVLVPLLVGLDPATALFSAGIGTFIFHLVTKGKVPIFLGSSFAFIAPIIAAAKQWGMPGTIAGIAGVALVYFIMSALIKWQGKKLLDRLFPPVVIGPVIILIGLSLCFCCRRYGEGELATCHYLINHGGYRTDLWKRNDETGTCGMWYHCGLYCGSLHGIGRLLRYCCRSMVCIA